ncbi:MAG: methyl-accepting chemotaxis protein [Beijerinckiaceae bacterium]|jgi:methyl-accepting chemotaxis protein|nr:methyl-accepting chemotaxis protein [Beijerinckiaceae bacterium]
MAFLRTFLSQRSLHKQWLVFSISLVALAVLATTLIGIQRMNDKIEEVIDLRTFWSLRVATMVLNDRVPIFQVENNAAGEPERLKISTSTSLLDNMSNQELTQVVDLISSVNKGTATLFRWDSAKKDYIRVATTVKKPDGSRATGTYLGQNSVVYPFMQRKEAYRGLAQILGELYQTGYLPITDNKGEPVGILYIGVGKITELAESSTILMQELTLAGIGILVLGIGVILVLSARVLRPLVEVANATKAMANGVEDIRVPHNDRSDEIGVIAQAVVAFGEAVTMQRKMETEQIAEARRAAQRKVEMDQLVQSFRDAIAANFKRLRIGATEVRSTSEKIRSVVAMAGNRVIAGTEAAETGAAAIAEVATATNQFAGSIAEIAGRSNNAAEVVRRAADSGDRAEAVAGELSSVVERISDAVSVISSIASQTNLLALNATIEAARAGEAGRGFAVVASEVKELSQGTSKAATEIAELVKSIEGVTEAVTQATREIGEGLGSINETTMVIAAAVTEQEQVTRDIAANADQASQRSHTIRSGFSDVQHAIEETAKAAVALDGLSHEFAASSDALIREFETFLEKMAA